MRVWLRSAKRAQGHSVRASEHNGVGHSSPATQEATATRRQKTGCTFRCRRSWMAPNSLRSKSNCRRTVVMHGRVLRGARYLLQGLVCCAHCGYAYYGKAISPSARKHHPRHYAYYRCLGTDAYRFAGVRVCSNRQIRTDLLDLAVWREACALLEQPHRLEDEYRQRLTANG